LGSDLPPTVSFNVGLLSDNLACFLAYLFGFVSGIIFLNLDPYRERPLVRFHAWQATLFSLCWIGLSVLEQGTGLFFLSWLFTWPIHLGLFVFWIILLIKAYNGEKYKMPILGNLAEAQANKSSPEQPV
jgi:uncharacterized membrane protein